MKCDDGGQVGPGVSQLERSRAAEAVADGRDPSRIHQLMILQDLQGGPGATLPGLEVLAHFGGHLPGFLRMLGNLPSTVHVAGEGHVTQGRQLLGSFSGVVIKPPPFMNDQHCGSLALRRIVPGQVAFEIDPIKAIVDGLGLHLRPSQRNVDQNHHHREHEVPPHDHPFTMK
jgi:hypothetical protein